jgi:hypothetical protein
LAAVPKLLLPLLLLLLLLLLESVHEWWDSSDGCRVALLAQWLLGFLQVRILLM